MKKSSTVLLAASLLIVGGCSGSNEVLMKDEPVIEEKIEIAQKQSAEKIISDFETIQEFSYKENGVKVNTENNEFAMKFIADKNNAYPGVEFKLNEQMNWQGYSMSFDIRNDADKAVDFNLRLDCRGVDKIGGLNGAYTYTLTAEASSTVTVNLTFEEDSRDYGMRGLPGKILKKAWGENLNPREIIGFIIFQMNPAEDSEIIIDNIKIVPSQEGTSLVSNIIDKYGQYSGGDWDGKVYSDDDLIFRKNIEEKELAKSIPGEIEGRSKFGGWKNEELRQAADEYFRVEKIAGKWWLIDPDGYPFFSTGLDIMRLEDMNTLITAREDMFEELPDKSGQFSEHYSYAPYLFKGPVKSGDVFNFYTANLEKKYGDKWKQEWKETALKRTTAWGFTSFGNWSDPEMFWGQGEENRVPYFGHGWINGEFKKLNSGSNYWGPLADPFDAEFRKSTRAMAETLSSQIKNDPWCIGVFVDNEMSWGNNQSDQMYYGLIYSALEQNIENSPAKVALLDKLKDKYSRDISKLNDTWQTEKEIESWEDLEKSYSVAENLTDGMKIDLSFMLHEYAKQYYRVVREELKTAGIDQMYVGNRMADWGRPDEVVRASAEFCDVVSFNWYKTDLKKSEFELIEKLDVPCIIGEFHFGSKDRGQFMSGIVSATNQETRGEMYKDYIQDVLDNPFFVGAHWFQYYDQPTAGRAWDGENYNTGFVSVTDTPYDDLVKDATEINNDVYTIRHNSVEYYNPTIVKSQINKISFEDTEQTIIWAYEGAQVEMLTNNVTDGTTAMKVKVGKLDSAYGGVVIPASEDTKTAVDFGSNPVFKADVINPNNQKIQLRMNFEDMSGNIRTYYFSFEANESRTIKIDKFEAAPAKWSTDGYWGADSSGVNTSEIKWFNMYLWEDNDFDSTADEFIIDNIRIENS